MSGGAAPLRVLVAVKRCVDYAARIRVLPDHSVREEGGHGAAARRDGGGA